MRPSIFLEYYRLSKIFTQLRLADRTVPNYFFQILPAKIVMSNVNNQFDHSETGTKPVKPEDKRRGFTKEERKKCLKERRQQKQAQKVVGFSDNDRLKQTSYYFENGLRKVYPYIFAWNTTAKERWFKRTLVDIYKNEFTRAVVSQSVEQLIESGKIRVCDYFSVNRTSFLLKLFL